MFLRAHLGLWVWMMIFGIAGLVCALLGVMMSRSGLSVRPIFWFLGFVLIVGLPQFGYHLMTALRDGRTERPIIASLQTPARSAAPAESPFGSDVDPQLIQDPRPAFGEVLAHAETARFAVFPSGESVLLAHFPSAADAVEAWIGYLRFTGLADAGGTGDSERGFVVSRPAGDRIYALPFGSLLGVWSGSDDATILRRMAAGGFQPPPNAPLVRGVETESIRQATGRRTSVGQSVPDLHRSIRNGWVLLGLPLYFLMVALYFFKGAAWAGSSPAKGEVTPVSARELMIRLDSINSLDVPFQVEPGARDGELLVTWRYADAKWTDLARAHGLRRVHRIRLTLDPEGSQVRATDYAARSDWSVGAGAAAFEWKALAGITFFEYEHQRIYGLQLGDQGQFVPKVSYQYTFDLHEMKQPLINAVTKSGWTWRPVVWEGPTWLRWLTE